MTSEKLKELFEDYHAQVVKAIDEQISSLKIGRLVNNEEDSNSVNEDYPLLDGCIDDVLRIDNDVRKYKLYTYDGKFWHVPKDFIFPKDAKLLTGWLLWVGGQPGNKCVKKRDGGIETIYNAPVRPFRLLKKKMLPMALRKSFSLCWEPIYNLMSQCADINFNENGQESFKVGYEFLKTRVEYVFLSKRMKPDTWCISYWSVKVQNSSIMKYGTENDKSHLPSQTLFNKNRIGRKKNLKMGV